MELRDYLRIIRVRKWAILQAIVIVALSALVASLLQPKSYEGEAKVLISEKDTGAALFGTVLPELSSQPERGLQTQVQLAQVRPLADKTIRRLDLHESPESLLARLDVAAVGQTNLITIKAVDNDPEQAARIANTMAEAYVEWSKENKRASIRAAVEEVEDRLDDARGEILALGEKISASGKSDQLAAELQIATGAYTTLAEKLEQLRVNEQLETGSGSIVSPAVVPVAPFSPKPVQNTALGLVVGLAVGLAIGFLSEYLDNTVKSDDEAEKYYGVSVLCHIPFVKLDKGVEQQLAIIDAPGSAAAESYRVLRNSLDFINFEHNIKTLMVTSSAPGEGKSTVAANLAASLAQAGQRVALVSCDFRRPTTERFFDLPNILGLSDVLLGKSSLKAAMQRPSDQQLVVLTSGKMPPNPSELLSSAKMSELVKSLEEWADWVILDTPPLLAVADGAAVARWVDRVLMVSRAAVSTRESAKKGSEMLANIGANVMGVVITGSEQGGRDGGYYSGSQYYSGYYNYYTSSARRSKKQSAAAATAKDGAESVQDVWSKPPAPSFAQVAARVLLGMLSFVAVLVVVVAVVFFLDQYFGWGLVAALLPMR